MDGLARLKPTLWRTCRVLAHRRRIGILALLLQRPGLRVSDVARHGRTSMSLASQDLRRLSARGLLTVRRAGALALHRADPDPAVPTAGALLEVVADALKTGSPETIDRLYRLFTAFTHPRRIALVRHLHRRPCDIERCRKRLGFSAMAMSRHVGKLVARGFIRRDGYILSLAPITDPVAQRLLDLACT